MLERDEIRLLELKAKGKTLSEIANILGKTYDATRYLWRGLKDRREDVLEAASGEQIDVVPLRPITIEPPTPPGAMVSDGDLVSVHYGDTHFPFQDPEVLAVLLQIIEELQPDQVVHHGDLLDAYPLSDYEKNPEHRVDLQEEIRLGAEHLAQIAEIAPEARRLLIEGNHEDRLRRVIWKASENGPLNEILYIPEVRQTLRWPALLGLESSGWEWEDSKEILFGKMVLKHGSTVRKHSGYSARAELDRYSKSGLSGHTHRLGAHFVRDWNGYHGWWELGCCCRLDPEYTEHPNWQNGFAVVTWSEDREHFQVELVTVSEGRAVFRGSVYEA